MKEDKFEQFIRDHRDEFDDLEPGMKVWTEIEINTSVKKPFQWRTALSKAAAVLIIFGASFVANELWHQYRNPAIVAPVAEREVQEIHVPELLEAEMYYTSRVEEKMKELKVYGKNNPDINKELQIEIEELDEAFAELKEDLKDDIANEEIVEAMIQNYRIKLKMLEEIISQLKSQQDNTEEDEVVEYEI